MTFEQLFRMGKETLLEKEVPEAELNAWYLLQACVGDGNFSFQRSDFFLRREEPVTPEMETKYRGFLELRSQRIPLEYITGYTEFMGLVFFVNEHVLIPRQDTETLVEYVLPKCENKRVLDLCTGSGCIGLSIGILGKPSYVMLSDQSKEACRMAEKNLQQIREREGMKIPVELVCGNLWEPVYGTFDVVVSNPPYIESEEISSLMPEVRDYEPEMALDGGADGLDFYRKIIDGSSEYLNPGGMLCFEIGYNQGKRVASLMEKKGFRNIEIKKDLAGNDRVAAGRLEEFDV